MAADDDAPSPTEKLSALVAARKAAGGWNGARGPAPADRRTEAAAAARSASKSRPAPRK